VLSFSLTVSVLCLSFVQEIKTQCNMSCVVVPLRLDSPPFRTWIAPDYFYNVLICKAWCGGQHRHLTARRFLVQIPAFCVDFACSPCLCVASLWELWLLPIVAQL